MDKKRKLPTRAAARIEQAAKKRATSPPEPVQLAPTSSSSTPVAQVAPKPLPAAPLPAKIQPNKPLPVVEQSQPDGLPASKFQSLQESGVLAESLARSRNRWMVEGLFEKYWSKPSKKKPNASDEGEKNPPKESMSKLGQVTITIEPHVFEATLYSVKDPKQPAPQSAQRPILQYGPAGGTMPPPAVSSSTPAPSPRPLAASKALGASSTASAPGYLASPSVAPMAAPARSPNGSNAAFAAANQAVANGQPIRPHPPKDPAPLAHVQPSVETGHPPAPKVDPIVMVLAARAARDDGLRDIMKKVAENTAEPHELARFQSTIAAISQEDKMVGQGPPADQIIVDGRSVQYFAVEVNNIVDIVFKSDPRTTSTTLRPPMGSDPLVVELVKTALDDQRFRNVVRRVANGQHISSDVTELKDTLERLHKSLPPRTGNAVAGHLSRPASYAPPPQAVIAPNPQALRSKGPAPVIKPDMSAAVFEFAGGNGDRFTFPKFSILEYIPGAQHQQVIVSFLLVHKGSISEYGLDPKLDYYQPITLRISAPSGKYLESLSRIVAPPEEVRRYMDDIMDNATRSEYILLAMRLPKPDASKENNGTSDGDKADKADKDNTLKKETISDSNTPLKSTEDYKMKPIRKWIHSPSTAGGPPPLSSGGDAMSSRGEWVKDRETLAAEEYDSFMGSLVPDERKEVSA